MIDNDERLDSMCVKCKNDATSTDKCSRCGEKLASESTGIKNRNFDNERYERLKNGTHTTNNEDNLDVDSRMIDKVYNSLK